MGAVGKRVHTVGSASAASVNVADDDDPGPGNADTLMVSIVNPGPDASANCGEFFEFTVWASETAQQEVTVSYSLSALNLVSGWDYCIIASGEQPDDFEFWDLPRDHDNRYGEVTIAEGEDSATIFVWIDCRAWVNSGSQLLVSLTEVEGVKEITQGIASVRVTE